MRTNDELLMEQVYSEGVFDRMRAKSAGRQAERDAGAGLKAKALGGLGKLATGSAGKYEKILTKGTNAKNSAQVNFLAKSYMDKMRPLALKFQKDIQKLGIDISMVDDDAARTILGGIINYPAPAPVKKTKKVPVNTKTP